MVELTGYIVEKKHRRLAVAFARVMKLCDLEREHQGARLSLRTVVASLAPLKKNLHIVGLRSEAGKASSFVLRSPFPKSHPKSLPNLRFRCCLLHPRMASIAQGRLSIPVDLGKRRRECRSQRSRDLAPAKNNPRARYRQSLVVTLQQLTWKSSAS